MEIKKIDLAVLGAGPGGYVAAIRASKLGIKTLVIEKENLGGVCLNWGCIPTKTLFHTAEQLGAIKKVNTFGIKVGDYKLDFKKVMERKELIVNTLRKGIELHFAKNKVEIIKGEGKLIDTNKLLVKDEKGDDLEIIADNIIIATGSSPSGIPPFNFGEEGILTNRGILSLDRIPSSILVVGGGVVGCEFANIFSAFGSKVTIIEVLPRILSTEDEAVSELIQKIFEKKQIKVLTSCSVDNIRKDGGSFACKINNGESISIEKILVSVGRKPNSSDIGIEEAGISTDEKGFIKVDSHLRTNISNIYAVGDVIGGLQLAHVASEEGKIAAKNISGEEKETDYNVIPWAIFTSPEIGKVGLTESQAREKNIKVCTGNFPFNASGKAFITGDIEGFVKIVTDSETGEILGAEIVGPRGSDLIHEVAVAMKSEMVIDDLASTVHSHPTLSEAVMEAAEDCFGIATHK